MKKKLCFWMAAAIALTSCSTEELVEQNHDNAIDFRVTMGAGVNSRGESTTTANLGAFYVSAFLTDGSTLNDAYFENVLFTKDAADATGTTYTSDPVFQWLGKTDLTFFAHGFTGMPATGIDDYKNALGATLTLTKSAQTLTGFKPATDVTKQIDFVSGTAVGRDKTAGKEGLELPLNHNLFQIQVLATASSEVYDFSVCGVQYGNIGTTADFNLNTATWTTPTTPGAYEVACAAKLLDATPYDLSDIDANGYAMLIPQKPDICTVDATTGKLDKSAGAYIAVKLNIKTHGTKAKVFPATADEYDWAYIPVPASTVWEKGKRYVYTLDFSKGAGYDDEGDPILKGDIKLTSSVTDWVSASDDPIELPM